MKSWVAIGGMLWVCACAGSERPRTREEADGGWLAATQRHISEREYFASQNDVGLQAPNRAHNLRAYFENSGIRVHDRTAGGSPELLRLSLAGVGRGEPLVAVAAGEEVVADENRVEIRRPGLVEWYVNSEAGLEQGFTLAERPAGEGALVVELAVAGARTALLGDAVVFATGAGRRLRYGELVAFDAAERPLSARFEKSAERLRIVVDDSEAVYPVVIDPLLGETSDSRLWSSQPNANLGTSVAGAGDVNGDGYADVILGAPLYDAGQSNEGAAFVFHGSASGIAEAGPISAVAQLESDQANAELGRSAAGAGDVNGDGFADVIVGAEAYDAGQSDEGAAFVFHGSASGVADGNPLTAAAQLESDQVSADFGRFVAGAGDVNGDGFADVIVGAQLYDAGQTDEGAAFVFHGSASGVADGNPLTAAAQLESDQAAAEFGRAVAGAGDVNADGFLDVIVGAQVYDAGQSQEGAAFVFHGSASGVADGNPLTAAAQLESDQASADLGRSVAGAGDVNGDGFADVIVGARFYGAGQMDEGAAFVFHGSASGIADGNPLTAVAQLESDQLNAFLGSSVAGAGDVNGDGFADVVVGAEAYETGQFNEGAVFVFLGSASGIADGNPLTAAAHLEMEQADAHLGGESVAGAGDVNGDGFADVIAGAPDYELGELNEGVAFIFLGGLGGIASGDPLTASAQLEADQDNALLGYSVAGAGDVNGDGYGDVLVGAPGYDAGETGEGAAFVFHGSASGGIADGDPDSAAAQLESDQDGAFFGESVAGAGDVNGDGYADVIVGAGSYDAEPVNEGAAFVFHGSASGVGDGTPENAAAQLESDQASAQLGFSVAGAGDVNGDGYADVIAAAVRYSNDQSNEGAAFVFHGSASGVADGNPLTADAQLESNQAGAGLTGSVAGAGDVNADGYADVIVAFPHYSAGQTAEGAAFVFHGSASGVASGDPGTAATQIETDQPFAEIKCVSGAGDVNGDHYADVVVGSSGYDLSGASGAFWVFDGSASGVAGGNPEDSATQVAAQTPSAGSSVAGAGDVNGDGYADVIAGAPSYANGLNNEGAAFVFLGSATGIPNGSAIAVASAQLESNQEAAFFGTSVASAGDVNGDGFADVIVGANSYTAADETDEGAAFVFLGGNGDGREVLARQRRGDGSGIAVQPWGSAASSTGFAVEIRATHPAGSGRVRGEIEACPAVVPFGDASCTSALTPGWVAVNSATPDALLSQTVAGLGADTLYRWRARVLHVPSTGTTPPNPPHGPWRRYQAQTVEGDIRLPEPGFLVLLASGVALVGVLARRRRR